MAIDKAVDSGALNANLTSVANAIRTKGGTSAQLAFPTGFVSAINAIPTGSTGAAIETKQMSIGNVETYVSPTMYWLDQFYIEAKTANSSFRPKYSSGFRAGALAEGDALGYISSNPSTTASYTALLPMVEQTSQSTFTYKGIYTFRYTWVYEGYKNGKYYGHIEVSTPATSDFDYVFDNGSIKMMFASTYS